MGKHIFETLSKAITKSLSLLGVVATAIIFVVQLLVYEVVKKSTGIDLSGGNNIPLVTIGILAISFLVVFIFYFFWELQAVFIRLNFKTKVEWDTQNDQVKKVYLMVDYQEPVELTDCFASLVGASQLYPSDNDDLIELNLIDHGILKWKNGTESSDCKIELPPAPESKTEICVAILQGRLFFCYCNGSHRSGGIGLFLIRMRLDGKLKGNSIRPKFFNGYLYANNVPWVFEAVQTTTQELPDGTVDKQTRNIKEPKIMPVVIFEEGDWTKDRQIPENFRKRKIIYGEQQTNKKHKQKPLP